jgi:hypothetical protein
MTRTVFLAAVLPACIACQLVAPSTPAWGADVFGGVGGMTRDSASKQPVAQVRITAHNLSTGTDRTATSRSDGTFTVPDLEPGRYHAAAARDGFLASVANVEVAAPGTALVDFLLTADTPPAANAKTAAPAVAAPASRRGVLAAAGGQACRVDIGPRTRDRSWTNPDRTLPAVVAFERQLPRIASSCFPYHSCSILNDGIEEHDTQGA